MRVLLIFAAAAAMAVLAVGCESFRGDDGKSNSGSAKKESPARKRKAKRDRDPYNDMFFGLDGAKAKGFSNDNLSPREQSLLDEELRRQDDEMRGLKRMHRDMDSNRSKRKEWVYGFKPLGGDK
jgi:hypothetical protein